MAAWMSARVRTFLEAGSLELRCQARMDTVKEAGGGWFIFFGSGGFVDGAVAHTLY